MISEAEHSRSIPFSMACMTIVLVASLALPALAADTADNAAVEEILVVTGVARPVNKLEASVSTSSLSVDDVAQLAPRSAAEIFRGLPGIRAESSGGGGNANITIRGIPLATGGAKYLQIHEDGLPVVEFGDLNFANGDNFIRTDWSLARIESIRGGSASTLASNSPGGIINLISDAGGADSGGRVGLSFGADYDELRTDFEYGDALTDNIDFHLGGFYRQGEGVRDTGFNGNEGGQIKLNVTRNFEDGFLRFHVKHLDDKVSTYLPSPVRVNSNGDFGPVAGYDASSQSLYSRFQTSISTHDAFGNGVQRDLTDGIESKVDAFGFEFQKDAGDGWSIDNKFRTSKVTGGFISPFTDGVGTVAARADGICAGAPDDGDGTPVSGCTGTIVTDSITGDLVDPTSLAFNNLIFDTTFNDVGLLVNDLKINKSFENVGPLENLTVTGGFYKSKQNVDITWNAWQFYLQTVAGGAARNLDVQSTTGQQIVQDGLYWPGLLSWAWNLQYDTTAPYLNIGFDVARFSFDASVRHDRVEARGNRTAACCGADAGVSIDVNSDGSIEFWESRGLAVASNFTTQNLVNYSADNTAFSVGGSWLINDDMSVFARYSDGGRAVADRLLQIDGALNPDGTLDASFDGYDNVRQVEIGYKLDLGHTTFYATAFDTRTEETNAEITSGATFIREYKANGVELEGSWQSDAGFGVNGNLTWTDAEISKDKTNPGVVGNTPRRQADVIYTLTPQYRAGRWLAGLTVQGSTSYFTQDNNQLKQDAYNILHLFGRYEFNDALAVSFNVNNLTDEFVVTEVEEGSAVAGDIVRGRPLSGRSSTISVDYRF